MLKIVFENTFCDIKKKYNLTTTEIRILLFLAVNQNKNTARDIVDDIMIAKSHISMSVEALVNKKIVIKNPDKEDKKKMHLVICDDKKHIIEEILEKQKELTDTITQGLTTEEIKELERLLNKIKINIRNSIENFCNK